MRWSSYKEVRAVCNIVKDHTRIPIDSFKLGDELHVRAVQPGEVRIVPPNGLAKITRFDPAGHVIATYQEMPTYLVIDDIPLLPVCIDQGRIGLGGFNFVMNYLKLMVLARFDRFHRGIRDIVNSSSKAASGVLRRTMLFTAYIFGLNYAPFGRGRVFR